MRFPVFRKKRQLEKNKAPKVFISSVRKKNIEVPQRLIFAIVFGIFIILGLYFLFRSDIFLVKEISFEYHKNPKNSVYLVTEKDIKNEIEFWEGHSIFTFPEKEEEKRIKEKFIALKDFNIKKQLPDTLLVLFSERSQIAIVKTENEELILDEEGFIFARNDKKNSLPVLEGSSEIFQLGKKNDSDIIFFAIDLLSKFSEIELTPARLVLEDFQKVSIQTEEGISCIFSSEKNIETQIFALQLIIKNAKIEGQHLKKIDLRFERPVIAE